ncbi:MAG: MFS transporter [Thermodesulfobacteriota bacterium]
MSDLSPRERSVLTVACYGHFMSHFNMLVFPAILLPLAARTGMSMGDTLALSFWMYLLFGLTALPWGIIGDRFGPKPLLALFFLGSGLSGLWVMKTFDDSVRLAFGLGAIGFFSGIYHPVGLGWVAGEVKKTSRGLALNGMFGNLGLAMAPLLAGILNYFYGPEMVYVLLGIMNLAGLLLLLPSRDKGHEPVAAGNHSPAAVGISPYFYLLTAMMLGGIVYRGTSVSLPAYFELQNRSLFEALASLGGAVGSANVAATLLTSAIYLVGMGGQYLGGRVGERMELSKGYLIFHVVTIPAAVAMALTANSPLVLFAAIHSFFLLGMQPLENTLLARLTPPKFRSSAYGLKFVLTFGVGALSVKVVEGVAVNWGLNSVFFAMAAVSTLLVGTIYLLNLKLGGEGSINS